jgi:hypothetical protein
MELIAALMLPPGLLVLRVFFPTGVALLRWLRRRSTGRVRTIPPHNQRHSQ